MSREILFKAKRKNWRELPKEEWWVEGYPIKYPSGKVEIREKCIEPPDILKITEIDPETICQYTGLTDKNGKRIWENDILDGHIKRGAAFCRSVVLWNEVKARFDVRVMGCNFPMTLDEIDSDISIGGLDYQVIGNRFDNPELLQEV